MAATAGMALNTLSVIPWRAGNLMTSNLAVNAVSYATPPLTITWLTMLGITEVARPDLLVTGAVTITVANLALAVEDRLKSPGAALVAAAAANMTLRVAA